MHAIPHQWVVYRRASCGLEASRFHGDAPSGSQERQAEAPKGETASRRRIQAHCDVAMYVGR